MPNRPTRLVNFEKETLDLDKKEFIVFHSNAQFFSAARPKFDAVYAPSYPHIEEAYKKIGRKVWRPEKVEETPQEPVQTDEEESTDWREMKWPKLRSYAKNFTDEPITSKEQAEEVMTKAEEEGKL